LKPLVLDVSTTLGLVIEDERSMATEAALDALRHPRLLPVPGHWWAEVANGLLMAERRKRASQAQISQAIQFIRAIPVVPDGESNSRMMVETLGMARQFQLTVYDAAYLELALRTSAVLATLDKALARAAAAAGVELLRATK